MSIALTIIGAIVTLFSGIIFFSSNIAVSSDKNWEDFMKHIQEDASPIANYPEDVIYKLVCKIHRFSCIIFIVGLIILGAGIAFTTIK